MALLGGCLLTPCHAQVLRLVGSVRGVHSTSVALAGARYRESKQLERHVNRFREIADTPDWSYLDGRPAPLNVSQRQRYFQQMNYNQSIQRMLFEIDSAKAAEVQYNAEVEMNKQRIIASKLKPKGSALYRAQLAKARQSKQLAK